MGGMKRWASVGLLLVGPPASGQDALQVPAVPTFMTDLQHVLLEACKAQCSAAGFCCGRDSGCGRPSCVLGCEIAVGSPTLEVCNRTCQSHVGGCAVQPLGGFLNASTCSSCRAGLQGSGTCKEACEPPGGCAHACGTSFQAASASGPPPREQTACFERGVSYQAQSSAAEQPVGLQASAFACQAWCATTFGCVHFTWYPEGRCLLGDHSALRVGSTRAWSGPRACVVTCAEAEGTTYRPAAAPSQEPTLEHWPAACQSRCGASAGCAHFMWLPNGTCHLLDGSAVKVPAEAALEGVVVGPPICEAACHQADTIYTPLDMVGHSPSLESTAADCQARCRSIEGCRHFTYDPDQRCHLEDAYAVKAYEPGRLAGPAICTAPGSCIAKGYYYEPVGTTQVQASDWQQCQRLCAAGGACERFSFWPGGGCVLLDRAGGGARLANASEECERRRASAPEAACDGREVVSGPRGCGPEFYALYARAGGAAGGEPPAALRAAATGAAPSTQILLLQASGWSERNATDPQPMKAEGTVDGSRSATEAQAAVVIWPQWLLWVLAFGGSLLVLLSVAGLISLLAFYGGGHFKRPKQRSGGSAGEHKYKLLSVHAPDPVAPKEAVSGQSADEGEKTRTEGSGKLRDQEAVSCQSAYEGEKKRMEVEHGDVAACQSGARWAPCFFDAVKPSLAPWSAPAPLDWPCHLPAGRPQAPPLFNALDQNRNGFLRQEPRARNLVTTCSADWLPTQGAPCSSLPAPWPGSSPRYMPLRAWG